MLQAPASYKLYWIMPTNNVGSQTRRDLRLQSEILIGSPYVRMDQSCEATSPQAMKQCDCAEILTLACVKARRLAQACLGGGLVRPAFPFITRARGQFRPSLLIHHSTIRSPIKAQLVSVLLLPRLNLINALINNTPHQ